MEFILFSFFFRYWVSITRYYEDSRLISDKTRINYCSFSRGQDFSLGIRLTKLTIHRSLNSFKGEVFSLFSRGSLRGIILEFGFLSYPKLCSWFFNEQRQLLMRLHPLRNKQKHIMCPHPLMTTWQLFMRLHPVMNERQLT